MAYAVPSQVMVRNAARTYTATSKPSASQIPEFLTETAGVLDGILAGQDYAVPVDPSATVAFALLQHYNAIGAWAMAERSAPNSPHRDRAEALWDEAQKMLRDGLVVLPDASKNTELALPRSSFNQTPVFFATQVF